MEEVVTTEPTRGPRSWGIGLAVALVVCSLAGLGLVLSLARVLLECRAG